MLVAEINAAEDAIKYGPGIGTVGSSDYSGYTGGSSY
jgi:hypothetical protein